MGEGWGRTWREFSGPVVGGVSYGEGTERGYRAPLYCAYLQLALSRIKGPDNPTSQLLPKISSGTGMEG